MRGRKAMRGMQIHMSYKGARVFSSTGRIVFAAVLGVSGAAVPAFGSTWTQPTPDELKMTTDPAAPDAPAVYLFREETEDDNIHYHRVYARIKILNDKGREEFGDIELPYNSAMSNIKAIEGRTIHSDGTVIPFTGKPYDKMVAKAGDVKVMEKVFSMPDVQVGSIIEYAWELRYNDNYFIPPDYLIQQPVYVHKAHYHFVPLDLAKTSKILMGKDSLGKETIASRLLYLPLLPAGVKVQEGFGGFDLVVENVPPIPTEEFSPPLESYAYRLKFYYSQEASQAEFWGREGKVWSKDVDRFANPSDSLRQAVAKIVSPADTDEQKLKKIYAAVMTLENTSFTREHSASENKAEGLRVKTASDIWEQKRGSDDEITRLFIAMARAAGFKAWDMIIPDRARALFNPGYLDWDQLDDEITIVEVAGKDVYLDPGQRYCEYGKLHWKHDEAVGFRQTAKGVIEAATPVSTHPENTVLRTAFLELGSDGQLKGQFRITMTGAEALHWRQHALREGEDDAKTKFDDDLRRVLPAGVEAKTDHFIGLTDSATALMAVGQVSGTLGTRAGKRLIVPADIFQANEKAPFAPAARKNMVDLHYPYVAQDDVTLMLPPGTSVASVPTNAKFGITNLTLYTSVYAAKGNQFEEVRQVSVGSNLFKADEYPQLRDFFQKASAQDQQQVVLEGITSASSSAGQ